jgi:hypothetical protein
MYTHITNTRISTLSNTPSRDQLKVVKQRGKPAGLWYAHGSDWKKHFYKNNRDLWKYTLNIGYKDFTSDYTKPAPTKILRLNKDNFAEVVAKYGKACVYSNREILSNLIFERNYSGDDTLNFIVGDDDIDCDSENNNNGNNNNNNNNNYNNNSYNSNGGGNNNNLDELKDDLIDAICNIQEDSSNSMKYISSDLADDVIKRIDKEYSGEKTPYKEFNWERFWNIMADNYAGVDFTYNILSLETIPNPVDHTKILDTDFIKFLEIRSGVIFKPATFFKGRSWKEEKITKNSGESIMATRKHKHRHRKTKKHRRTHKK